MALSRQSMILCGGIAVLVAGVALQWLNIRNIKEGDRTAEAHPVRLGERMPRTLSGWRGRDEPLGPNEVTRTAAERILNYDDYVFRVFEKDGRQVSVYIAYWAAGRMPLQKVASHTPDRCWTENGWRCEDMRFEEPVAAGKVRLRPSQWRRFVPPGNPGSQQFVVYWHLVGDRLYDYGMRFNARPDFVKWWRDTLEYAFSGSDAQYFIRLTSDRPFEELKGDPGWEELLAALAKLGLAREK